MNKPNSSPSSGNGIGRDVAWVVGLFFAFQLLLFGATKLEGWLGIDAFRAVELLSVLGNVFAISLFCWLLIRFIFPQTLGADFGEVFDQGWSQLDARQRVDRILLVFLVLFLGISHGQSAEEKLALPVSQDGVDLIVYYEVGGRSYYESRLERPTWPGGGSGVTIGFGYDVGYNTRSRIASDWQGILSSSEIKALQSVAGLKGSRAKYALSKVKHRVYVSYEEAEAVFKRQTLPRFSSLTATAFRIDRDSLPSDCNAALVSLVFNRGSQIDYSDRRKEMAWIRHNIGIGKPYRVPGDIRSMKRIWVGKGLPGLLKRRDAEARLFETGLANATK